MFHPGNGQSDRILFGYLQLRRTLMLLVEIQTRAEVLLWEDGKPANKSVDTGTKILVIDASFLRVHSS